MKIYIEIGYPGYGNLPKHRGTSLEYFVMWVSLGFALITHIFANQDLYITNAKFVECCISALDDLSFSTSYIYF